MCVKAETFSATALPGYQSAKQALNNARSIELETQARRIIAVHRIHVDPQCNVRLDPTTGPVLLLKSVPEEARAIRGELGSSSSPSSVSRRLLLGVEGDKGEGCGTNGIVDDDSECQVDGEYNSLDAQVLACTNIETWGSSTAAKRDGARSAGLMQQVQMQQIQSLVENQRHAESEFLAFVTQNEKETTQKSNAYRNHLIDRENQEAHQQEHINRLDISNDQNCDSLEIQKRGQSFIEENCQKEREKSQQETNDKRLAGLWSDDREFFSLLAKINAVISVGANAWKKGFSLAPKAILHTAWSLVVEECYSRGGDGLGDDWASRGPSSLSSQTEKTFAISGLASTTDACALSASSSSAASDACRAGYNGAAEGTTSLHRYGADGSGGGEESVSALWWAWSTAGSAVGSLTQMGYSSAGWLIGRTLDLVSPGVQCEGRAVTLLVLWLLSLILSLKLASALGNSGRSYTDFLVRLSIAAIWIWGRYGDWLIEVWHELLLIVAPIPVLVLAYGPAMRFWERHRKPDGIWLVQGWDLRVLASRAVPTVVSCFLAFVLVLQSS